jgi:hypothetical protein
MNCLTFTGSPNFIKHLTNNDTLLVPKMFLDYKTFVNAPYKNVHCCKGEASNVMCHCICQKWGLSNVDYQKFKRTTRKLKITNFFSNLQYQNL